MSRRRILTLGVALTLNQVLPKAGQGTFRSFLATRVDFDTTMRFRKKLIRPECNALTVRSSELKLMCRIFSKLLICGMNNVEDSARADGRA
ncbi:hypothetical protein EVAR_61811_1 [Eumeta japonica]|uniref:Uncharacterized protein n=1 Tax=Eumeta variegata TaxID=151549 RepID=A0A4C1YY93_EUMVA|nr:hypothetical protein EVAR_61811_1 [Eumeta japonica]